MSDFHAFRNLPAEIQSLIFELACAIELNGNEDAPRLAIVRIRAPPAPQYRLGNADHLQETRPLHALLAASPASRYEALRAIARANPPPITQLLGLDPFNLSPAQDILYLRSNWFSFNYATALGFVIGGTFPNVMLDAGHFAEGTGGNALSPLAAPVPQSLQLLQTTADQAFNQLYGFGGLLPRPRVPRTMYFLLGMTIPDCPSELASHTPGCVHYDQLDIIPENQIDDVLNATDTTPEEHLEADVVRLYFDTWRRQLLGVALPTVFFARFPRPSETDDEEMRDADPFMSRLLEGRIDFSSLGDDDDSQASPDAGVSQGGSDPSSSGSSEHLQPGDRGVDMNDSGISMGPGWPAADGVEVAAPTAIPGDVTAAEDWFNAVYVPEALVQFAEKWKAANRNEPWAGRAFVADYSTPGPSEEARRAFQDWLEVEIRPAFQAVLAQESP